jgi:hypothetical protein
MRQPVRRGARSGGGKEREGEESKKAKPEGASARKVALIAGGARSARPSQSNRRSYLKGRQRGQRLEIAEKKFRGKVNAHELPLHDQPLRIQGSSSIVARRTTSSGQGRRVMKVRKLSGRKR